MAFTERHSQANGADALPLRLSVVRAVALCLVGVFVFLLTLHVDAHGWEVAGCGVYIVLAVLSFAAGVWAERTAQLFRQMRD